MNINEWSAERIKHTHHFLSIPTNSPQSSPASIIRRPLGSHCAPGTNPHQPGRLISFPTEKRPNYRGKAIIGPGAQRGQEADINFNDDNAFYPSDVISFSWLLNVHSVDAISKCVFSYKTEINLQLLSKKKTQAPKEKVHELNNSDVQVTAAS